MYFSWSLGFVLLCVFINQYFSIAYARIRMSIFNSIKNKDFSHLVNPLKKDGPTIVRTSKYAWWLWELYFECERKYNNKKFSNAHSFWYLEFTENCMVSWSCVLEIVIKLLHFMACLEMLNRIYNFHEFGIDWIT